MRVLGIETSCDETGVAIYDAEQGIMAEQLYSQIALHKDYGGVIPELASRDHVIKLLPMIDEVLTVANTKPQDIDAIAFTQGPGLAGALLVGASTAKALGLAWQKPTLGIHHMEGHLVAALIDQKKVIFPLVALLVSGGHSQLVLVKQLGDYELLGDTLDDAAGEAFDKTATLLDLPYPGGPAISQLAKQGDISRFHFPRPMVNRPGLDFSFSGLKTHTLTLAQQYSPLSAMDKADIAAGFEHAVVDTLAIKCRRALKQTGAKGLILAGGVSANRQLRERLTKETQRVKAKLLLAEPALCTDNGAMIAFAGFCRLRCEKEDSMEISVRPRWPLSELLPVAEN